MEKLFIIMRDDMASLTNGRKMAMAAHAANYFTHVMDSKETKNPKLLEAYHNWKNQVPDQGFGTVIVLNGGKEGNIKNFLSDISLEFGNHVPHGLVVDPEYFLRDGDTVHLLKDVFTCAWVFPLIENPTLFEDFELHA